MQFLYPLFLLAGLTLLIPILIHLFNLRRYKTVFFPHTRFLKSLQLHSRKQSQVRYKWLLAARVLFLLFLIAAFAQPYFASKKEATQQSSTIAIFVDNSQSMSLKNRQRSLFEIARENALHLVQSGTGKFLILSNDKPFSYKPVNRQQAIDAINKLSLSSVSKTSNQVLSELQSMIQGDETEQADLYYISDFQQNGFPSTPDETLLKNIHFNGVQIEQTEPQNVYIDTAFFETPVLQTGQSNKLIVRTKYFGKKPEATTVLQLSVAGNVKSAATPVFNENKEHYDTLSFQINDAGWQRILLTLNDANVRFDDTFSIAARSTPDLSVLLLNESQPNVFIQAALRSYSGFKVTEQSINAVPQDLSSYNLVLLNGLTRLDETLANILLKTLQNGQNVALFFGQNANKESINSGLKILSDLQITGFDTAAQTVTAVQSENRLVKDMFERMPDNVQLPYTQNHYQIKAGLSANQQSIFSFRNGDPFFAVYSPFKGQLYLCATTPDAQNGNFQSSYFFVPFLYQMASLAKGNSIFALSAGQKQAIYINQKAENERELLHIKSENLDVIPPQRAEGMGVQVFAGEVTQKAGFYTITSGKDDSTIIGVNMNRNESNLAVWTQSELKKNWSGKDIKWQLADAENKALNAKQQSAFPLWKLCSILALLMLGVETWLLSKNLRKQNTITT
ncbi:MAG: BatA domain-containing protein [Chitinophagaceae bacterium]